MHAYTIHRLGKHIVEFGVTEEQEEKFQAISQLPQPDLFGPPESEQVFASKAFFCPSSAEKEVEVE